MSQKPRNPILIALVTGLSVSLAAPIAQAQNTRPNCIILPDGTRQCDGTGPRGGQPGQPPQGRSPQWGQKQGQPPQWAPQQGQPRQGGPGLQAGQPGSRPGPMPGASARTAPVFQQALHSRLPPPPAREHYRVMNGMIVRVNNDTLRVIAVVGPLSAILNSN